MGTVARVLATVAMLVLGIGSPAAATVLYTFSGADGLAGTFTLDDTTPFVITDELLGTGGTLMSPLNSISGVFGDFTFAGIPSLFIFDLAQECCNNAKDFWIIRSDITGPSVNGLTPAKLNLFMYQHAAQTMEISLTPPPIPFNQIDFSYAFVFSDGNFVTAPLTTLTLVPEPASLLLLGVGLVGLLGARRLRRV